MRDILKTIMNNDNLCLRIERPNRKSSVCMHLVDYSFKIVQTEKYV